MRGFIKTCSSLFVVLGMIVIRGSIIGALIALAGGFSLGALIALAGLGSGASVTLVGGGTYLLASLDERMERLIAKGALTAPRSTIPEPAFAPSLRDMLATLDD